MPVNKQSDLKKNMKMKMIKFAIILYMMYMVVR